ncbi:hypothetical protein P9112_004559 [Eukaryota sp. TZLM1-RC]
MSLPTSDRCTTQLKSDVFSIHISSEANLVAVGLGDGTIAILSLSDGSQLYSLVPPTSSSLGLPVTAIRWRPSSTSTPNVLLSGHSDGHVHHWHATSSQLLHSINEPDNHIFCIAYRQDGTAFATAGKDTAIRVYDEQTKSLIAILKRGVGRSTIGHTNRVFSVCFSPSDPHTILSSGWDNTVVAWDVRQGSAIRSFYGPHVCGDALSVCKRTGLILTGSWRHSEQVQLWKSNGELDSTFEIDKEHDQNCLVYACQFLDNGNKIIAGGSGSNIVRIIDRESGGILSTFYFRSPIYTIDSNGVDLVIVGTGDGTVRFIELEGQIESSDQSNTQSVNQVKSTAIDSPGGVRWNRVVGRAI